MNGIPVDIAHLIQVALTPIFLISAIGVTLNVLTSRLARIVDRARAMEKAAEPPGLPARRAAICMRRWMCWRGAPANQLRPSRSSRSRRCSLRWWW